MDVNDRIKVREFIGQLLRNKDDAGEFSDSDSLFVSGRLDSLSAVEVVGFLEEAFGVDFSDVDFEMERIDSIDAIATLVAETRV